MQTRCVIPSFVPCTLSLVSTLLAATRPWVCPKPHITWYQFHQPLYMYSFITSQPATAPSAQIPTLTLTHLK